MSKDTKIALLGFSLAALMYWAIQKTFVKKDQEDEQSVPITPEGIDIAVAAYRAAIDNKEDLAALNQLNEELSKQYGVKVGLNSEGRFVVTNQKGIEIKAV
jgi:hypothetical protein